MDQHIEHSLKLIEETYIRRNRITGQFNVNRFRFAHSLRPLFGQTNKRHGKKMLRALRLLRNWRRTVEEIAREIGYCWAASFTRDFKKQFGKTPSLYRRESLVIPSAKDRRI